MVKFPKHKINPLVMRCYHCGASEVQLPTDCPGRTMTPDEADAVQAGRLDYFQGRWIDKGGWYERNRG